MTAERQDISSKASLWRQRRPMIPVPALLYFVCAVANASLLDSIFFEMNMPLITEEMIAHLPPVMIQTEKGLAPLAAEDIGKLYPVYDSIVVQNHDSPPLGMTGLKENQILHIPGQWLRPTLVLNSFMCLLMALNHILIRRPGVYFLLTCGLLIVASVIAIYLLAWPFPSSGIDGLSIRSGAVVLACATSVALSLVLRDWWLMFRYVYLQGQQLKGSES